MTSFHLFYFCISQLAKRTDFLDYLSLPSPVFRVPEADALHPRALPEPVALCSVGPSAGSSSECVVSICTNAFYLL